MVERGGGYLRALQPPQPPAVDTSSSRGFLQALKPSIRKYGIKLQLRFRNMELKVQDSSIQVFLYLNLEQLFEELRVDGCQQVVGKVQLGQEVQARETLWIQAVTNRKASNTTE